jgi:hypothetical protein
VLLADDWEQAAAVLTEEAADVAAGAVQKLRGEALESSTVWDALGEVEGYTSGG